MDPVSPESFGLFCPHFSDELVGRQALEGLESSARIAGGDQDGQLSLKLLTAVARTTSWDRPERVR